MGKFNDLTGQSFGQWHVIARSAFGPAVHFDCVCKCGTKRPVLGQSLSSGKSLNCGCVRHANLAVRQSTHGCATRVSPTRAYECWKHMRSRCLNLGNKDFSLYGGRGIRICDRWSDFSSFLHDMGEPGPGLSLDRVDPNGNYEPANCRWATRAVQVSNRRPFTQTYRRGEQSASAKLTDAQVEQIRHLIGTKPQSAIAADFGVSQSLISQITVGKTRRQVMQWSARS